MAWIVQNRQQAYQRTHEGPVITEAIRREIEEKYFPRYPRKQAALLPLFHLIMHEYGWIPPEAIDEGAALLGITPSQVQDAVSFYEEFRFDKSGKYVVNVCRSISCEITGFEAIKAKIREVFGIDSGETTEDDKITFFEVECVGCCEQAPCALVNGKLHGNLTPEGFVKTLQGLPAEPVRHGHHGAHAGAADSPMAQNMEDKRRD